MKEIGRDADADADADAYADDPMMLLFKSI